MSTFETIRLGAITLYALFGATRYSWRAVRRGGGGRQ
ncbi:hypothetical protein Mnod_6965 [Methylobacterium nodulans ORS 2060]|uniref:Uncharacterized protein n=1 Tax=Methylobacterium nodulans (strain LMG 21967 / CNCM I-2342 / ORS 2060) TaxID=460265 RepID=B8IHP4_METNO|nr:hypothetical protein Mnod_6965 [Methylobacterium nodulans ORS 2060]